MSNVGKWTPMNKRWNALNRLDQVGREGIFQNGGEGSGDANFARVNRRFISGESPCGPNDAPNPHEIPTNKAPP